MFAVIDAECGHLSWTIQSKNEFINIFPAPIRFSLGAEDFAFCFLFTSTHMYLSLGQDLGQPVSFCPSTVGRVILREIVLILAIKNRILKVLLLLPAKSLLAAVHTWKELGVRAHEAAPPSCKAR